MLTLEEKAKLKWRCRRGMLELDLLLERFCDHGLSELTQAEGKALEQLLQMPDPDLLACLMGYAQPIETELRDVVTRISPYFTFK